MIHEDLRGMLVKSCSKTSDIVTSCAYCRCAILRVNSVSPSEVEELESFPT